MLPENVVYEIHRILFSIQLLPELKERCVLLCIEECVKKQPFVKTISYISNQTNIELQVIRMNLERSKKVYKIFNNLYNTVLYFHRDNLHYV